MTEPTSESGTAYAAVGTGTWDSSSEGRVCGALGVWKTAPRPVPDGPDGLDGLEAESAGFAGLVESAGLAGLAESDESVAAGEFAD